MNENKGSIAIAGAGIAGLSAALELAARGWTVRISEKAQALSEVGAGLQLAPNAMRHLERLGVAARLAAQAVAPQVLYLMDGRSARPLMAMPLGAKALERWRHPYLVCHRADLQAALLSACRNNPAIDIRLGETLSSSPGDTAFRLGCDGVWSAERDRAGFDKARFSGHVAWRTTLAADALPASFTNALPEARSVSAWLGPDVHFIAYPVKGGDYLNFVAITKGGNPGEVWSKSGDRARLQSAYRGWSPAVRDVIAAAPDWTFWPLFEMTEAHFLAPDQTILLGDASHAVTPFAAQGAAMAIEDAAALAETLDMPDRTAALARFETVRKARIAAVAKRGKLNRFAYHATGPFALGRNMLFAWRGADSFLKDLDWLYAYDAVAAMRG